MSCLNTYQRHFKVPRSHELTLGVPLVTLGDIVAPRALFRVL